MGRLVLLLGAIFLVMGLTTYLLFRVFKKNKAIKYIPGIIMLVIGVYNIYLSRTVHNGFEDIARVILALMFFAGFLAVAAVGIFMDYVWPRMKKS